MHAFIQHLFLVAFVTHSTTHSVWPVVLVLGLWHKAVTDTFLKPIVAHATRPGWILCACMLADNCTGLFFLYKLYEHQLELQSSSVIWSCFTEIQKLLMYCMCELSAQVFAPGAIQLCCSTSRSSVDHDAARFVGPVLSNWALPVIKSYD